MYLSFVPVESHIQYAATLVRDPQDQNCVFQFFAVIRERDNIEMQSYSRIRHRETGMHAGEYSFTVLQFRASLLDPLMQAYYSRILVACHAKYEV